MIRGAEEENFYYKIFPGGSAVKNSAANAGDPGLIPGVGRSPVLTNSLELGLSRKRVERSAFAYMGSQ